MIVCCIINYPSTIDQPIDLRLQDWWSVLPCQATLAVGLGPQIVLVIYKSEKCVVSMS